MQAEFLKTENGLPRWGLSSSWIDYSATNDFFESEDSNKYDYFQSTKNTPKNWEENTNFFSMCYDHFFIL